MTRRARRGFTLAELIIVVVLLGIVGSAITTLVVRQQRFYRGASQIIDTRSQLRQAASILPTELRGLSSIGGDFRSIAAQRLEFNATIGSSIVCNKPLGNAIGLPPMTLSSGTVLTSFLSTPSTGDIVWIYNDGTDQGGSDDTWFQTVVLSPLTTTTTDCNTATGFTRVADALQPRTRVTLRDVVPATVLAGAAVRFTRPVRYNLYQASDTRWYLGYEQFVTGAWNGVQPVSGPYLAGDAATEADRGLQFRLYNEAGVEVTTLAAAPTVSRVDIVVRGQSREPVQLSGTAPTRPFRDSLNVSVAIRNRQ